MMDFAVPIFAPRAAVSAVLLLSFMAGCAPAVRYTSGQPAYYSRPQPPAAARRDDAGQQALSASANTRQDDATAQQPIPPIALRNDADKKPPPPPTPQKAQPAALPESVKKKSVQHLEHAVKTYIGTPYKYGGMSRSGVDCSGFVSLVFQEVYGKPLPRSARDMWRVGVQVPIAAARPGDLIFFKGGSFSTIDHVGIYLGNNKFAHASSSVGVTYSNAKDTYYARRLAGVKRVL